VAVRPSDIREPTTTARSLDMALELTIDDELTLRPDAARVLARIVRQHLDRHAETPRLSCHTRAPH
jgi:hypothetical protein